MHDVVDPGGRRMTGYLQSALDNLPARQRAIAIRVLSEMDPAGMLGPLYRALVIELQLCGLREQETDVEFRQMTQDSIDAPSLPPPTGPRMQYDPETGELSEIPDDSDPEQS